MSKCIICADAIEWLRTDCPPCSIVTSPPLAKELSMTIEQWAKWYTAALELCFARMSPGVPAIIYQTDQKSGGRLVSSFELIVGAARAAGLGLLWHKIALRRDVGKTDIHRPGFSHLIALGGEGVRPGAATPDAMHRGTVLYPNGMGMIPARLAVEFVGRAGMPIVDPFCGKGTVPAVAEALGFDAIGVDIDPAQCAAAERLRLRSNAR